MNLKLYPNLSCWNKYQNIWLYSDPHFNDEEAKSFRKNYISDDEQVKRINSKVGKNDILIMLGDIGDISYIPKIRGYKVLIKGNHDIGTTYYKKRDFVINSYKTWGEAINAKRFGEIEDWYCLTDEDWPYKFMGYKSNHLFDEVYEGPLFINNKILLSHEPIDLPYVFNIHGHDHSNWHGTDDHHINLCAELINYEPVSLKSIINSGVLKNIPDIHRVTVDMASKV